MVGILAPITFSREIEGSMMDLTVPEEFIRDFHFSSDEHLMIMIRVMGRDSVKVRDFFEDGEEHFFTVKTVESDQGKRIEEYFTLISMYMDEGPSISVDINQEPPMVRLILDFQIK